MPVVEELLELEPRVLQRQRRLLDLDLVDVRIRCHGDYCLDQLMWTGRDVLVVDLDGDPARTLGERRIKRSPLTDVAAMLDSFDEAVAACLHEDALPDDAPHRQVVERWFEYWTRWIAATFLGAYLRSTERDAFVPHADLHVDTLLEALRVASVLERSAAPDRIDTDALHLARRRLHHLLEIDT